MERMIGLGDADTSIIATVWLMPGPLTYRRIKRHMPPYYRIRPTGANPAFKGNVSPMS